MGTDRAPTDDVRSVDGLTAMDEPVGIIVPAQPDASQMQLVKNIDPYHTESVAAQCQRFYKLGNFSWSAADGVNTSIFSIRFPEALYAQPFIQDKFKDYLGMRADVVFYLRVTSTVWNYGTLMCGHIPFWCDDLDPAYGRMANCVSLSQSNGSEINAETGISKEFRILWSSPHRYVRNLSIGVGANLGVIGTAAALILNRLAAAGGSAPDPVTISVYARFDNLELAGYSPDTSASRASAKVESRRRPPPKTQSATSKEAASKSDVMSGIKEATNTITGIIGSVTDAASVVGDIIETLGPLASLAALNKPTTVSTPVPTYQNFSGQFTHGRGIDIGSKISLNPDATISVAGPIVSSHNPQPTLKSALAAPTLVQTWEFTSASPLYEWNTWLLNPSNCARLGAGGPYSNIYQPTYMAYYGNFFKLWHGGMNLLLTFHTSANVQADFRIAHFPEVTTFAAPLTDYDGDIVSEVIAVHGNKEVKRFFADISTQHWRPVDTVGTLTPAGGIGAFAIALETAISTMGSAVDASIYVNLYAAAGADFDFSTFISDLNNPVIDPMAYSYVPSTEANLQDAFSTPFPGIRKASLNPECGFINADPIVFITDLVKRYSALNRFNNASTTFGLYTTPSFAAAETTVANQSNKFGRLIFPYLFWRGSVRVGYRPLYGDTDSPALFPIDNVLDIPLRRDLFGNGICMTRLDNPVFCELPWTQPRLHLETIPSHTQNDPSVQLLSQKPSAGVPTLANAYLQMFISSGDDLSLGPLSACPSIGVITVLDGPIDELNLSQATKEKLAKYTSIFDKAKRKADTSSSSATPPL